MEVGERATHDNDSVPEHQWPMPASAPSVAHYLHYEAHGPVPSWRRQYGPLVPGSKKVNFA